MEAAMKTEHGRYVSKAIYTILTLNIEGKKELLGLYLSDQEGAHHWLSMLTGSTIGATNIPLSSPSGATSGPP